MEDKAMKKRLTKNLGLKLLAVVFASALWFFVAGQSNTEVGFVVPLGVSGIPKDMAMTSAPPGEIEVRLRGSRLVINNLTAGQISAEVNLSKAKEGLHRYRLLRENISTPTGVEVVRVKPVSVAIRLEKIVKGSVPVKARWKGTPALGYRVISVKVDPEKVDVEVLKKKMRTLKTIYTKAVDINGLKESRGFKAELDINESDIKSISAKEVGVTVLIEKKKKKGKR